MKRGGVMLAAVALQFLLLSPSAAPATTLDIVYKTVGSESLKVDIYTPSTGTDWSSVIIIHGGGWDDRKDWGAMAQDFAANGFAAFVIEYRLAPTWTSPAPVEDARDSLAWVREHADEYGASTQRVAYFGGSAGGQIALVAALGGDKPSAVVTYSGIADLTTTPNDLQITKYMGCSYSSCPLKWEDGSVQKKADLSFPPTFMANGTTDSKVPSSQATNFTTKLDGLGVPNTLQLVNGSYHSQQLHGFVGATMYQWLATTFASSGAPPPEPSPTPSSCT